MRDWIRTVAVDGPLQVPPAKHAPTGYGIVQLCFDHEGEPKCGEFGTAPTAKCGWVGEHMELGRQLVTRQVKAYVTCKVEDNRRTRHTQHRRPRESICASESGNRFGQPERRRMASCAQYVFTNMELNDMQKKDQRIQDKTKFPNQKKSCNGGSKMHQGNKKDKRMCAKNGGETNKHKWKVSAEVLLGYKQTKKGHELRIMIEGERKRALRRRCAGYAEHKLGQLLKLECRGQSTNLRSELKTQESKDPPKWLLMERTWDSEKTWNIKGFWHREASVKDPVNGENEEEEAKRREELVRWSKEMEEEDKQTKHRRKAETTKQLRNTCKHFGGGWEGGDRKMEQGASMGWHEQGR